MPLTYSEFKGVPALEACLIKHSAHIKLGAKGDHVARIQKALITLGAGVISPDEIARQSYGKTTAKTVLAYKTKRGIINKSYQDKADDIVGMMTIERLDAEMAKLPAPSRGFYIATGPAGAPHDHAKCPRLAAGDHELTPIKPSNFGRRINIYGEHETDYLDFEDYAVDPAFAYYARGKMSATRPLTWTGPNRIADRTAGTICMRSAPITTDRDVKGKTYMGQPVRSAVAEIDRIAMNGCIVVYGGNRSEFEKIRHLGILLETVERDEDVAKGNTGAGLTRGFALLVVR